MIVPPKNQVLAKETPEVLVSAPKLGDFKLYGLPSLLSAMRGTIDKCINDA
jgi:hypothetical protein